MMIYKVIKPESNFKIVVRLPGSKSISNRLLIISALSRKKLRIVNLSDSDDTSAMIKNLESDDKVKNIGHAGTAMRFMVSYYSLMPGESIMTGSERMKNRPVGELVSNLRKLGADISYMEKENYPPLYIKGGKLRGGSIEIDGGISSQFISSLLMIAPMLPGGLELRLRGQVISASYINMTLQLMKRAGIEYIWEKNLIRVREGHYTGGTIPVEPDWSSASYWYEIAALSGEADITLAGLTADSLQGDAALTEIFSNLGVKTEFDREGAHLEKTPLSASFFEYDFSMNPDLVQTVVPTCVVLGIPFHITGTQTLRIKETDRITAMYEEMKKFGVRLDFSDEGEWIAWDGKSTFNSVKGTTIQTYDDHRMAMSFAPLALKTGSINIDDPLVVTKSYPLFWNDLKTAGFILEDLH